MTEQFLSITTNLTVRTLGSFISNEHMQRASIPADEQQLVLNTNTAFNYPLDLYYAVLFPVLQLTFVCSTKRRRNNNNNVNNNRLY